MPSYLFKPMHSGISDDQAKSLLGNPHCSPLFLAGGCPGEEPLLHAGSQGVHEAVLVPGVVAEVPHVQYPCHSVGLPRAGGAADEHKGHGGIAVSRV